MPGREEVFDTAAQLARALATADSVGGWEPLRDIVLAGFDAGGLRPGDDPEALRRAAGELAAAALSGQRRSTGL